MGLDMISECSGCGELETECRCVWLCGLCLLVCSGRDQCPCQELPWLTGVRCGLVRPAGDEVAGAGSVAGAGGTGFDVPL
jgi:hypothetical protein